MAKPGSSSFRNAVVFAAREIASHPAAQLLGEPAFHDGGATLAVEIDLRYGATWRARGASPTGVLPREEVRFEFPADFPGRAPTFSLRPGFSRNHPHVQPWLTDDGRVVPCVLNGAVGEFIAARGFHDLVAQILDWLEGAAEGRLMNLKQGWEPARRDTYQDLIIANGDRLTSLVNRQGGFGLFATEYACKWTQEFTSFYWGELKDPVTVKAPLTEKRFGSDSEYGRGEGLALVVWPGRTPGGKLIVCDHYVPDDVATVGDLFERARLYGVENELKNGLAVLRKQAAGKKPMTFPLVVTLLVRRPARVIGTNSDIEICSYLTPNVLPVGPMMDLAAPARPVSHRDAVEPGLLRRMSGDTEWPKWVMLGCGSLGSKVAAHAGRSGNAPDIVADKGPLSPHNAARHALFPGSGGLAIGWLSPKAKALAETLEAFRKPVTPMVIDHVALARHLLGIRGKAAKPKFLVNTTASLVVRESLSADEFDGLPRGVEMSLFDGAGIGYVGVEGTDRNPNASELVASLYHHASGKGPLRQRLLGGEHLARVATGQGCGSLTMVVSDARLSAMAAVMTEALPLDDTTAAGFHLFERDGLGMKHEMVAVAPFRRIPVEGLDGWSVSVSEPVHQRILEEKGRWPRAETGGVLVGWSSPLARRLVIVDLIDAPKDSRRTAAEFLLGVTGLPKAFAALAESSAGLLRCIGTWHSHLGSAAPSPTDKNSARVAGACDAQPLVFLISGVDGLRAISAAPEAVNAAQADEKGRV
jgi:Prokaryotic E2 family A/Prokaryotic homologs of the JAB domain